jgi:transmembrane 9 superfamily protein 2/4
LARSGLEKRGTDYNCIHLQQLIQQDYGLNWMIDGLPAAEMKKDYKGEIFFDIGGFNL